MNVLLVAWFLAGVILTLIARGILQVERDEDDEP